MPISHNPLVSDTLKCRHNIKTNITHQKIPASGKEYTFFQTDGRTSQAAQCTKSRALTKVVGTTISIGLSEQKCVIIKRTIAVRTPETTYGNYWGRSIVK